MAEIEPFPLMASLVLEDGRRWGEIAAPWQRDDAEAVLDNRPSSPRLHWVGRARGGSKTLDASGLALTVLLAQAPARSVSHAFARDLDQARLLLDSLAGLATRTGLLPLIEVTSSSVAVRETGARLVIESADAASAFGALPFFVVVDELCQWPTTKASKSLWEAVVSGLPKRRDSRLLVITSAGDPAGWQARIMAGAKKSPRWRVSETPGPVPWLSSDDLEEQRRLLPESSFQRLHLNRWVSPEDRLVSADDLTACVVLDGPLDPDPRHRYVVGVDVGLKKDRTAVAICHADHAGPDAAQRVVLDRVHVLEGTKAKPVELATVEALIEEAARQYHAQVLIDPWQSIGMAQRLRARGVRIAEFSFTAQSVAKLAMTMHLLLRERRMALPGDLALLEELGSVRLRETSPNVFRMDHDSGQHDDMAIAVGLAALALTETPDYSGQGMITNPAKVASRPVERTLHDRTAPIGGGLPALPTPAELRRTQRQMSRGTRFIVPDFRRGQGPVRRI